MGRKDAARSLMIAAVTTFCLCSSRFTCAAPALFHLDAAMAALLRAEAPGRPWLPRGLRWGEETLWL